MKSTFARLEVRIAVLMLLFLFGARSLPANIYINEIYFDPPSGADASSEYIELRGDPNMSLANHYLIFLENEISATANPAVIENIFDFNAIGSGNTKLGSNGYLTIRQAFTPYSAPAAGTTDLINTATLFTFGSGVLSSVGHSDIGDQGEIENSGFTAMLIRNDGDPNSNAPMLGQDLDTDDDRFLDVPTGAADWVILDSIGLNSEISDIDGYLYAPVNFSAGTPSGGGNNTPGTEFVDVGYEIEHISRWGDSTGSSSADWHATNLTNNGASGYSGGSRFRQAGAPHGVIPTDLVLSNWEDGDPNNDQFVETSQGLPYGTEVINNLGSSNKFVLDGDVNPTFNGDEYVFDGRVDAADFLAMQRFLGFGVGTGTTDGFTATRQHGDTNGDRLVDTADISVWEGAYGASLSTATVTTVPEPGALLLLTLSTLLLAVSRSR